MAPRKYIADKPYSRTHFSHPQTQEVECYTQLAREFPVGENVPRSTYGTCWMIQQEYYSAAGENTKVPILKYKLMPNE